MKKILIGFIIGGAMGVVGGAGAMLIAFPFLFPPSAANESVAQATVGRLLVESRFREDADGQDAAHWGRGSVKVYEGEAGGIVIELQSDFEIGPGPNFWLYLNAAADINNESDFNADGARIKLAKIRSFQGSQVYQAADSTLENVRAITIWCETFGQYIASANLN